nr:MBL fold metallo-hydrolase [Desulfovibrio inopinatus]
MAVLDGGQYDPRWPLIHMTPEEAVRAADDMGVKSMILTHVGKFCISAHSWDEPFNRVVEASQGKDFRLLTPKIGKPIRLDGAEQSFSRWWEDIN